MATLADNEAASLDWGKHNDEILDLLITQNKTVRQVMEYMEKEHNFKATERQYKYHFPRLKNVTDDEWAYIGEELQRQEAGGKYSMVCLHGRPLPSDRVIRGISRAQARKSSRITKPVSNRSGQIGRYGSRISFRTSSQVTGGSYRFGPVARPSSDRVGPDGSLETLTSPTRNDGLSPGFDQIFGVEPTNDDLATFLDDDACAELAGGELMGPLDDLSGEVEADFSWINAGLVESQQAGVVASSDLVTGTEFTSIMEQSTSWGIRHESTIELEYSRPASGNVAVRSPSTRGRLSPFTEFVDPNPFPRSLMANLPYFQLLSEIERPEYRLLGTPSRTGISTPRTTISSGFLIFSKSHLSKLLGPVATVLSIESAPDISTVLQSFIPERHGGDLSTTLRRVLDTSLPVSSTLPFLFTLAASFSANNRLQDDQMDAFLRWVIQENYVEPLARFMEIQTPMLHSFAKYLFESAIRIKNIQLLDSLICRGIKLDSLLDKIAFMGDANFTRRVLMTANPACFTTGVGGRLFHHFVETQAFDLARILLDGGVSVDVNIRVGFCDQPAISKAIESDSMKSILFLLEAGANINLPSKQLPTQADEWMSFTAFGYAIYSKKPELVSLFLGYNPDISTPVYGKPAIEWASLHSRNICALLKKHVAPLPTGILLGDLVEAAGRGSDALAAYINEQPDMVTQYQLEQGLLESIYGDHFMSALTLLQRGVDPDGLTLRTSPLMASVSCASARFVHLLLEYKADCQLDGLLQTAVEHETHAILSKLLDLQHYPINGMKALVKAAEVANIVAASTLLRQGVNIDTPGLRLNPLQAAALSGWIDMMNFFISKGANVNHPAHPDAGRTALQAALSSGDPINSAELLLCHGADVSAPPALFNGATALEAFCNNSNHTGQVEECTGLVGKLLEAGATVNRPNGNPSYAVHGVISERWPQILARLLEPRNSAIIGHYWSPPTDVDSDEEALSLGAKTPVQLAASIGCLEMVEMLLNHGADVNDYPNPRYGRTALQGASLLEPGPSKMKLVEFLINHGAEASADPAVVGGLTALQAAAISGDLQLVEMLLSKRADVNGRAAVENGRYAIEGAAEHGRLDMVQMLLNAGAKGSVHDGTGFTRAIGLARRNDHSAIVNILEAEQVRLATRG